MSFSRNKGISTPRYRLVQRNLLSPQHPAEVQCLGEATILLFAFRSFLAFVEIYPVTQLPTARGKPLPYASERIADRASRAFRIWQKEQSRNFKNEGCGPDFGGRYFPILFTLRCKHSRRNRRNFHKRAQTAPYICLDTILACKPEGDLHRVCLQSLNEREPA